MNNDITILNIELKSLPWNKTILNFHWHDVVEVLLSNNNIKQFIMFCRKSDCKCFIENLDNKQIIEFNGAKAHGLRLIKEIVEKEIKMRTKRKHIY